MDQNTQQVIDGLKHGVEALDTVIRYATTTLEGMADLGATTRYRKLLNAFNRLNELRLSLVNLYTLLELESLPGLWQEGRGRAEPKNGAS